MGREELRPREILGESDQSSPEAIPAEEPQTQDRPDSISQIAPGDSNVGSTPSRFSPVLKLPLYRSRQTEMQSAKTVLIALLAGLLVACSPLLSCSSGKITMASSAPSIWVVGWGNSPENASASASNPGGSEMTYRMFFYPTVSGTMERVHFSNYFGTAPITIGAARLAIAATVPAIDPANDAPLSFGGSTSVTIAPGQSVVSDPVSIAFSFGKKMAVSMYLTGVYGPITQHVSNVIGSYNTPAGAGDKTTDAIGSSFSGQVSEWYLLSGMDVYGQYQGTVALLGSSTIDGHNSNFGNQYSYPTPNVGVAGQDNDVISDWLARELNAEGYQVGILNAGTLGDSAGIGATSGVERIGRDVLTQPSVKTVVISLGSIDLRGLSCQDAPEVETALTNMVSQAQVAGVRVILATVAPSSPCQATGVANSGPSFSVTDPWAGDLNPGPENPDETQRRMLNDWIRTTGKQLPGVVGIADFDSVLSYTGVHPDFMIPNLNSGDNFHPNGLGYKIMAQSIPLNVLMP